MALPCSSLPPTYRVKNRCDFLRLGQRGRIFVTGLVVIQWGKSNLPHARIGITVVRRFGSAVERNCFRRRAKEAFRLSKLRNIPGLDLNLRPKQTLAVPFSEFCRAFEKFETYISLH